ncbi:MAG TPA: hypothetical protein VHY22_00175 [Chthoniobacteraceae bacterium]|jgi:hypothetical protein|nr:hypothetical protein [Chthoniobacteraceae bacterium]
MLYFNRLLSKAAFFGCHGLESLFLLIGGFFPDGNETAPDAIPMCAAGLLCGISFVRAMCASGARL